MRELSLFTGAGGGLLGTHLLGWEPVGYVEWNEYCQQVIAARIRDGYLREAPIFTDVREFVQSGAAREYRGIADVVTAGFPCQPFSVAGKQLAASDERNMWPATRECIRDVQPRSVLLENVPGLVSCGYIGTVLCELAEMGYVGKWGVLGASAIGAPHHRKRLWIVAHTRGFKAHSEHKTSMQRRWSGEAEQVGMGGGSENVAYAPIKSSNVVRHHAGFSMERQAQPESRDGSGETHMVNSYRTQCQRVLRPIRVHEEHSNACGASVKWWRADPADVPSSGVDRVVDGMADDLDQRLKAIGNGQVPAVVRAAWELMS